MVVGHGLSESLSVGALVRRSTGRRERYPLQGGSLQRRKSVFEGGFYRWVVA